MKMTKNMPAPPFQWLTWAREIQALAQTGLVYSHNDYDLQLYHRLEDIAAQILVDHTTLSPDTILKNFHIQRGYAIPKIDVRAAIIRVGRFLFIWECSDGAWAMLGGWADVGESPAAMVAWEVQEESGCLVRVDKLVAVLDANRVSGVPMEFYQTYKLIFLCTITGGQASPSSETSAVDFFHPAQLPPLSSSRTGPEMLAEVFAYHADPTCPAVFD